MGKRITFDVYANAKATGFDEAGRKVSKLGTDAEKSAKSLEKQTKQTGLLSTALLSIGTAAIPVAGVAAGALVGLGAAAAVALVGVLGIRDAMKQGTTLGKQYEAAFKPVVSEFALLKQIGARGLFDGINAGVKSLKPLFPTVNRDVALFSSQIGQVVGHAGPGLVALFSRLTPLFATIGDQLVRGSKGFEQWAKSSDGVGRFVAYVQTSLPQVEQTFGSLVTTISHVAIAAEPFGGTTLTAIRLFSGAINAIPIGTLQTVVPLLLGLKVGNTISAGLNNASASMAGFAKKTAESGLEARATGRVVGTLGKAVGYLGPVGLAAGVALGGLSVIMGRSKQAAVEDAKRVNDLTQAIQNQTTATTVLAQLQESGAVKAGKDLGVTQKTLVQAVLQHGAALDAVKGKIANASSLYAGMNARLEKLSATQGMVNDPKGYQQAVDERNNLYKSLTTLSKGLQQEQADYEKAKKAVQDWAKQQGDSVIAAEIANGAYLKNAKALGATGDAYINAKLAADQNAQSTANATLQMQLENNAAGLLDQALQKLGGNNLGVAQAVTALRTSVAGATAAFHTNGTTLDQNTEKGRANATALQGSASSAISLAKAVEQQTGSTRKGNAALADSKTRLENALRSQHQLTPAVQAYINTLFKIPPRRSTTIDLRDAVARAKAKALAAYISSFRPIMEVVVHGPTAGQLNAGKLAIRDSGGPVTAGTPYMIGLNRRPEIFIPGQSGQVVPIPASKSSSAYPLAHGAGATINVTVNVAAGADGRAAGEAITGALEKYFAAGGTVAGGQKAMR